MNISGISGSQAYVQVNRSEAEDSVIKSAQSRIEALRKQMRELAENEELDPKTKADKKQELQRQISDLQMQIRERQRELAEQKRQPGEQAEKEVRLEEKSGTKAACGISRASFNALLSADNTVSASKTYGSTAAALSGRARELQAELKADSGRGAATEQKQEELADVKARAEKAKKSQAVSLARAAQELNSKEKMRSEAERDVEKKENSEEEEKEREKDREFEDWA